MQKIIVRNLAVAALVAGVAASANASVKYADGDKYVKFGGRIQLQYHQIDPDGGEKTDELFFRRFRPYIEGSVHKDWTGKFQWDMGGAEGDNELAVKDAYMQYKGFPGIAITVGNKNFPFSRELLTSSKTQQLVERTFVGDHNYGTPDRQAGVYVDGGFMDDTVTYGLGLAQGAIDPDANKLDFDSLVNNHDDWNQGWMFGGRIDYHPFGHLKMSQGDFKRELKATIGVAAFSWANDDDNNTYTDPDTGLGTSTSKFDVDKVTGFEVSGAIRGFGASVDAQYNIFNAETVDGALTGGIYENGETSLTNFAIEGGYMVLPSTIEIVAGYSAQDADNYDKTWTRTEVGVNLFAVGSHDIKLQTTYRMGKNLNGVDGADADELFVQCQYVF